MHMRFAARACGLAAIAVTAAGAASAQEFSVIEDSTVLGQNYGAPTGTPAQSAPGVGDLDAVIETDVFFKNLELIGLPTIEGQTFFGFLAPVRLRYRAGNRVTVEAGAVLGQDFGDEDELNTIEPLLRLTVETGEGVYVVAGTILPTHWIHDALFDDVQRLRDTTEQGFQFRIDRKHWKQDTWINWRIREGAIDAEEFEISHAMQLRGWDGRVRLDGQIHWAHAGGQISTSNRVDQNLIGLVGGSFGFVPESADGLVDDARIGVAALYSVDDTATTHSVNGDGWEANALLDLRPAENTLVRVQGRYFSGEDFLARRGDPLYGLDEYAQFGANAVFALDGGARIETGAVPQVTDDDLNYSYLINLTWGGAFIFDRIRPRS